MINFTHFFVPYIQFLLGAAYNIAQTLEGLKPTSLTFIVGGADPRMELIEKSIKSRTMQVWHDNDFL